MTALFNPRWWTTLRRLCGLGLLLACVPAAAQDVSKGTPSRADYTPPTWRPASPGHGPAVTQWGRNYQQLAATSADAPVQARTAASVVPVSATRPVAVPEAERSSTTTFASGAGPDRPRLAQKPPPQPKQTAPAARGTINLTTPPTREELFRFEAETVLFQRMRKDAARQKPPEKLVFPEAPVLDPDEPYPPDRQPALVRLAEPAYVCHRQLLFEDRNTERYGWDLGFIQPFVSVATHYRNIARVPWELLSATCRRHECSAGYCLPGTPVAYRWYISSLPSPH